MLVHEFQLIVYFTVCASGSVVSGQHEGKFDVVRSAVFSRGPYPSFGDLPMLNRKVFRSYRVSISEHPYIVSIRRLHSHYLTGVILCDRVVLTVAHPVYNVPVYELGVVAGENYNERGSTYLTVLVVVTHEDFDPYTLLADMALLRLFETVFLKITQKPIALFDELWATGKWKTKMKLHVQKAFVTGWGRCDWKGTELCLPRSTAYFPDEIQDPMLQTIAFNHSMLMESPFCKSYEKHLCRLERRRGMLCVGPAREEEPLAPCLAAPGAALTVGGRLVGVQSWGLGCGYTHDMPLVYSDVRYFSPWIKSNLKILKNLNMSDIDGLYLATKAYIIQDWLVQTSAHQPPELRHSPRALQLTQLDQQLIQLKGNVTDIRDYAYQGKLRDAKAQLYDKIKQVSAKRQKLAEIAENLEGERNSKPFLDINFIGLIDPKNAAVNGTN